ncbi:MAG: ATPase F0F1 [Rickettsiales bacterium]|nr:ATPase F0F1 [Rickettsiales bacterium]RPG13796.1 MAG: ATPase F0F1 [Pelagibacteraceae bacterium TMED195]
MKKIGIKKKTEPQGLGLAMKISLDLISPIIVGILIGLGFDKFFSTKPIFFLIFLLLGIITGFIGMIKYMKSLK